MRDDYLGIALRQYTPVIPPKTRETRLSLLQDVIQIATTPIRRAVQQLQMIGLEQHHRQYVLQR